SASVQEGPASNCVRSSTRTPARQLRGALFSFIGTESSKAAAKSHDSAGDTPMASNQPSVFIDGEAGTTGLGIRKRLEMEPEIVLQSLPAAQRKDQSSRQDMMAACDLVVLCLPDGAAREATALAGALGSDAPKLLDASNA